MKIINNKSQPYTPVSYPLFALLFLFLLSVPITHKGFGAKKPPINLIQDVEWTKTPDHILFKVIGTQKSEFSTFVTKNPPRIYLDVKNAIYPGGNKPIVVNKGPVSKILVQAFETDQKRSVRFIIGTVESMDYNISGKGEQILLYVYPQVHNRLRPNTLENSGDQGLNPSTYKFQIQDIVFKDYQNHSALTIQFKAQVPSFQKGLTKKGQEFVLLLSDTGIPKFLERRLDTSAFFSPVKMVSAHQDYYDKKSVRISVDLSTRSQIKFIKKTNTLVVNFNKDEFFSQTLFKAYKKGYSSQIAPLGAGINDLKENTYFDQKLYQKYSQSKYFGKRINIDIKDGDIHNILRLLAIEGNVNIVTSDEVAGKVTLHLKNVPWDQALDIILKLKGLGYVREANIIRIAPAKVLAKEQAQILAQQQMKKKMAPTYIKLIPISYADATVMAGQIKPLLSQSRGFVSVDKRTNTLIVRDTKEHILAAQKLIYRLDTPTPQVLIEARIVEANTRFTRQFGIQWGGDYTASTLTGNPTGLKFPNFVGISGAATDGSTPTLGTSKTPNFAVNLPAPIGTGAGGGLGFQFGSIGGLGNLNLRLTALEEKGVVKIISAPKISTLDNVSATIKQGVQIPVSVVSAQGVNTQMVEANLELTVKPQVTADGTIFLDIKITKNEADFGNVGALGNPSILQKSASTQLLVKDGDTTVIGGIYTRNYSTSYAGIPGLSSIPILGWLFKSKKEQDNRTEMLIFITPRIINKKLALMRGMRRFYSD